MASTIMAQGDLKPNRRPMGALGAVALIALMIGSTLGSGSVLVLAADPTATFVPTPTSELLPAGMNPNWTPVERDFNGIPMVYVPAGCFLMGTPDDQVAALNQQYSTDYFNNEKSVHEVCLTQGYWIGKYEITNADYQRFVEGGGYTTQDYWSVEGWSWRNLENITSPSNGCTRYSSAPTQPRLCISWYEADAFAKWWGGRLPTEAEWEYAARGPQSLTYPWGTDFAADNVVYYDSSGGKIASVGSRPGGMSWIGAYDLSGNVYEWVADWFDPAYYPNSPRNDPTGPSDGSARGLRGGSWRSGRDGARAACRGRISPDLRGDDGGFRVVLAPVSRGLFSDH